MTRSEIIYLISCLVSLTLAAAYFFYGVFDSIVANALFHLVAKGEI